VGVLRALEEAGLPIYAIAGVSVGAQVGGLYAAGVPLDRIEAMWAQMGGFQLARGFMPTFPYRGWSSGAEIVRLMRELVGDRAIETLPIRFAAVATDLRSGDLVALDRGPLVDAVRASVSVPGLLTPVEREGWLLVDGGLSAPLPVNLVRAMDAEVVVAVDVLVPPAEKPIHRPNVFTILFQMATIFQKRIADLEIELERPEIRLNPDFGPRPPSYTDARHGAEAGYRAMREALPRLRAELEP